MQSSLGRLLSAVRRSVRPASDPARRGEAGFSLLELLVTMVVLVEVMVAILLLFDQTNKLSRSQNYIADMQQQHRIGQRELVENTKMAGVGGLPDTMEIAVSLADGPQLQLADGANGGVLPKGLAIAVTNNVAANTPVATGGPLVLASTDILTLRGVLREQTYYFNPVPMTPDGTGTFQVTVLATTPAGYTQNLEALREALAPAVANNQPEALIVRDTINVSTYAVMELNPALTTLGNTGDLSMTLGFRIANSTNGARYADLTRGTLIQQGSGGVSVSPPGGGAAVTAPGFAGSIALLEEYRYYVREEFEIPGDATSRPTPVLARARVYPGTNTLHPDGSVDLADNVVDLQIALGVDHLLDDLDDDGNPITNGQISDASNTADEVLYNAAGDNDFVANIAASPWARPDARLHFIRISTMAQTDRIDPDYAQIDIAPLEDRVYAANDPVLDFKTRKRVLRTVINLRNS